MMNRILDANLNRLREAIRVIEDIARYSLNSTICIRLKDIRHKARINADLLHYRDIKNDISKQSNKSEATRKNLRDISIANFKRAEESARVIEELLKLDSTLGDYLVFKNIRYELYDIEIEYFQAFKE